MSMPKSKITHIANQQLAFYLSKAIISTYLLLTSHVPKSYQAPHPKKASFWRFCVIIKAIKIFKLSL